MRKLTGTGSVGASASAPNMFSETRCTYCGELSDGLDHVRPQSLDEERSFRRDLVVPCCRECNSALGARYLVTISVRASFLLGHYLKKYKRVIRAVDWSDEEVAQLGRHLASSVRVHRSQIDMGKSRVSRLMTVEAMRSLTPKDVWRSIDGY